MQPTISSSLSYTVLVVLLGVSTANASTKFDACFIGMKSLFQDNIKKACFGFTKGNMSEVSLEHLCSINGGGFNADKCNTTRTILSTSCGTDIQAITSSCQLEYPELKYPYCVDDSCYLHMVKTFPNSFETRCDAVLDGDESAFGRYKLKWNLWQSCDRSAAKIKSTCQCVRPRERKMEDDEKKCLGTIELHFGGRNIETACYQMLTNSNFLAQHRISLIQGCGTNEENIKTACKWNNKLLGYDKCLDNNCYRGVAQIYGHEEIPSFCSAVIGGTFTPRDLKSKPSLARQCGGKLDELKSACLCLYPAERYPHCSHDECFRGIAGDWGEDIAKNCRTVLTRNFTDGSDPECKNELEGLVQESKWLGLRTYAFQTCGKDPAKLMNACRCALPDVERTTFNVKENTRAAVTTSSTIKLPTPTGRRRLPFRAPRKSSSWTRSTTRTSSTVRTAFVPTLTTTSPSEMYTFPSSTASQRIMQSVTSVRVRVTTPSTSAIASPYEDLEESTIASELPMSSIPVTWQESPAPSKTSSSTPHAWDESTRMSGEEDDFVYPAFPTSYARPDEANDHLTFEPDTTDEAVVGVPDYDLSC